MHFYLFSEELQAWFSSLLEMKFLISEKYESSFSSKSAWLSGSEFGEEIFVPKFERIPECWLTATQPEQNKEKQTDTEIVTHCGYTVSLIPHINISSIS